MRRLCGYAALAASLTTGPARPPQVGPQFRTVVTGVSVHVRVSRAGRAEKGLGLPDFLLTDAGVRQEVTVVSASAVPIDLSLVVQNGPRHTVANMETFRHDVASAARFLQPTDRLRIVTFGDEVREVLPLAFPGPLPPMTPTSDACHVLYDAVASVLMSPAEPGRQHVVILMAAYEGAGSILGPEKTSAIARRSNARLQVLFDYGLYPGDLFWTNWPMCAGPALDWSPDRQARLEAIARIRSVIDQRDQIVEDQRRRLIRLAEMTGGGEIKESLLTGSIAGPVEALLDDVRSGYVLYYTPTGVPETGWHPISVTINRPGRYDVRARPGYER